MDIRLKALRRLLTLAGRFRCCGLAAFVALAAGSVSARQPLYTEYIAPISHDGTNDAVYIAPRSATPGITFLRSCASNAVTSAEGDITLTLNYNKYNFVITNKTPGLKVSKPLFAFGRSVWFTANPQDPAGGDVAATYVRTAKDGRLYVYTDVQTSADVLAVSGKAGDYDSTEALRLMAGLNGLETKAYEGRTYYCQDVVVDYAFTLSFSGGVGATGTMAPVTFVNATTVPACSFVKAHHTFLRWVDTANGQKAYAPGATIEPDDTDADPILQAQWEACGREVTLEKGATDATGSCASVIYDGDFLAPGCPFSRAGYAFAGWKDAKSSTRYAVGDTITGNGTTNALTLVAQWTRNTYGISFAAGDGATGTMATQIQGLSFVTPACTFVRADYDFAGWTVNPSGVVTAALTEASSRVDAPYPAGTTLYLKSMATQDAVSLTATWKRTKWYIGFDGNATDATGAMSNIVSGANLTLPACAFTRTGYAFAGWTVSPTVDGIGLNALAAGDTLDLSPSTVGAHTLKAQWTRTACVAKFAKGAADATGTMPDVTYGMTFVVPACAFARAGYVFDGWIDTKNGTSHDPGDTFCRRDFNYDPVFTATWASAEKTRYTLTFNGGTGVAGTMAKLTYALSDRKVLAPICAYAKEGFDFAGWRVTGRVTATGAEDTLAEQLAEGAALVIPESIDPASVTFTAMWACEVKLDAAGGTLPSNGFSTNAFAATEGEVYGDRLETPQPPDGEVTKRITFAGWWNENGQQETGETAVHGNVTLYARWTTQQIWSVTFKIADADQGNGSFLTNGIPVTEITRYYTNGLNNVINEWPVTVSVTSNAYDRGDWRLFDYTLATNGVVDAYVTTNDTVTVTGNLTLTANWTYALYNDTLGCSAVMFGTGSWKNDPECLLTTNGTESTTLKVEATNDKGQLSLLSRNSGTLAFFLRRTYTRSQKSQDTGWKYITTNVEKAVSLKISCKDCIELPTMSSGGAYWVSRMTFTPDAPSPAMAGSGTPGLSQAAPKSASTGTDAGATLNAQSSTPNAQRVTITFARGDTLATGEMSPIYWRMNVNVMLPVCGFTCPGSAFKEWRVNGTDEKTFKDGAIIYGDEDFGEATSVTLTAVWESTEAPVTYPIAFDAQGGTGTMPSELVATSGEACSLPMCGFTRPGYAFAGWTTAVGSATVDYEDGATVSRVSTDGQTLTLYAVWTPASYWLRLVDDGEGTREVLVLCPWEGTYALPACPWTHAGQAFAGWTAVASGDGTRVPPGTAIARGDVAPGGTNAYRAVWTDVVTYDVAYADPLAGTSSAVTYVAGTANTVPYPSSSHAGYVFAGWSTNGTSEVAFRPGDALNLDLGLQPQPVLTAVWRPATYVLAFDAGPSTPSGEVSGTMAAMTCASGTPVTLPACGFVRANYAFLGWTNGTFYADGATFVHTPTAVDETVTLKAVWKCVYEEPEPTPTPTPTPTPEPEPEPEPVVDDYDFTAAAATYEGYLTDAATNAFYGTVQVKASKAKVNRTTGIYTVTVTATVTDFASGKKWSYRKGTLVSSDTVSGRVTGLVCSTRNVPATTFDSLQLGRDGMVGRWNGYVLVGGRKGTSTATTWSQTFARVFESLCGSLAWTGPTVLRVGVAVEGSFAPTGDSTLPLKVTVKSLPTGLKYNTKTGVVTGVPSRAGTFTTTFTAKSTLYKGSAVVKTVTFTVGALDAWASGTFNGGSDEGMITLTVSTRGKISGNWQSDGVKYTLSAASYASYVAEDDATGTPAYRAQVTVKKGKTVFTQDVTVTAETLADGLRGVAVSTNGNWEAYWNVWKQTYWKQIGKYYNKKQVEVKVEGEGSGVEGIVTCKMASSGKVTAKGTFATAQGTYSASCSAVAIPVKQAASEGADVDDGAVREGCFDVFLYFAPKVARGFPGYAGCVRMQF